MKMNLNLNHVTKIPLHTVSDYGLIRELERRIAAIIENRGCLSDEFIAKLENLKKSAESVKNHL